MCAWLYQARKEEIKSYKSYVTAHFMMIPEQKECYEINIQWQCMYGIHVSMIIYGLELEEAERRTSA